MAYSDKTSTQTFPSSILLQQLENKLFCHKQWFTNMMDYSYGYGRENICYFLNTFDGAGYNHTNRPECQGIGMCGVKMYSPEQ